VQGGDIPFFFFFFFFVVEVLSFEQLLSENPVEFFRAVNQHLER
jgi:hypothetical protein